MFTKYKLQKNTKINKYYIKQFKITKQPLKHPKASGTVHGNSGGASSTRHRHWRRVEAQAAGE
jgi:hypothetical protein